jgi:DNA replication protein DnaC
MTEQKIELQRKHVTEAMLATLQKFYRELRIEQGEKVTLDVQGLAPPLVERLRLDLTFFSQNPHLPLENLCSGLDNYTPKTSSQQELLNYAVRLVGFEDFSHPAGLFIYGEPGVGKSHIAVAVSKEFMRGGFRPNFVQFSVNSNYGSPQLNPHQVWVLDDLNSPYGMPRDLFMKVALNAHNTGGRLFVTSNMDYHELMEGMTKVIGDAEAKRYFDRTRGMFKALHVVGESNRQTTAWYS